MKLTFVNVGYGEAILLECTDASREDGMFTALIDGGSGEEQEYADRSLGRVPVWEYLQEKGVSHLDLMICTHIHEDHVSGMARTAAQLPPANRDFAVARAFLASSSPWIILVSSKASRSFTGLSWLPSSFSNSRISSSGTKVSIFKQVITSASSTLRQY